MSTKSFHSFLLHQPLVYGTLIGPAERVTPTWGPPPLCKQALNMPSLQTKALVVKPISDDNFRIIPPNCMVS